MKKILLISDEMTPEDLGEIVGSEDVGLSRGLYNIPNLKSVLTEISGCEVMQIHHTQLASAKNFAPDYLFLSGRFTAWDNDGLDDEYKEVLELLRTTKLPTFGICAGLQLIGRAYGARIAPMADISGEHGFTELTVCGEHALLRGLGKSFSCMELHCDEVCSLPDGFDLLASTDKCGVQMILHKDKPMVGTQFHPELTNDRIHDGLQILRNFFALY